MPITPPIELISTIRPARWARIAGRTRCTTRTLPQKLVSSCALASCTDEHSAAPAQPPDDVPRLLAPVTVQPAACSRSAQARPMPAEAPVTRTDLAVTLMLLRSAARPVPEWYALGCESARPDGENGTMTERGRPSR